LFTPSEAIPVTAFDELKVRYAQLYYPPLAALIAAP
jgi:hypothetical protein